MVMPIQVTIVQVTGIYQEKVNIAFLDIDDEYA
jgi:hypothetical protein